jgi:AraC-like DNA-binding protein
MSLAALPENLPENPTSPAKGIGDLLSEALRRIRISGSLQYCFMPSGNWITDASPAPFRPANAMGFHIVAQGTCWIELDGKRTVLEEGDIAAFPFGTPHFIGGGENGRLLDPGNDLPPRPWREIPVLRYGEDRPATRILCGYIQCDAMNFRPFKRILPTFIHTHTAAAQPADWLAATLAQIVKEVDQPVRGGSSVLERLTEVVFMEVLRRQFLQTEAGSTGWLAAITDPTLGRSLTLIHAEPQRDWTLATLAKEAGVSRSVLTERFEVLLETSPIRYLRDWRLYLASIQLSTTDKGIAAIADESCYGTEAAFSRAFSRSFGLPPAQWRRDAQMRRK